jgi:hypothetical protein
MSAKYKLWENNAHTVTILKHLLWPFNVYWCAKCKKHIPAERAPGEVYALERAIRKLGGKITRKERKAGNVDVERGKP